MPLHDWAALPGWDGVHQIWIVELLYWIKPRLPVGYRAYIGTSPTFAIGAPERGDTALFIERQDRLVAAVELVSPRNRDRHSACAAYADTYVGYLLKGVNLLLVDVHRRPLQFSFADRIAEELNLEQSACPAPLAISYRVGEPALQGGRFLGIWRRPLTVDRPLPSLPLALSVEERVQVDLEETYMRAAAAAYVG